VGIAIVNEYATLGTELELACVICMEIGPNSASKSAKKIVVQLLTIESMERSIMIDYFRELPIDQKTVVWKASSQNLSGIDAWASKVMPISTICLCLHSAALFCCCVWAGNKVTNPNTFKERIQGLIFPSPVCLHGPDFFYQIAIPLNFGNHGNTEKLRICGESSRSR
jgi:hypothetical protein